VFLFNEISYQLMLIPTTFQAIPAISGEMLHLTERETISRPPTGEFICRNYPSATPTNGTLFGTPALGCTSLQKDFFANKYSEYSSK
jgi:hypothetical protein